MDDFLKELALDHRTDLFESALDGFQMSLEITGTDVLVNGVSKKVILGKKENGNGVEKTIAAGIGEISIGDVVNIKAQDWLIVSFPIDNEIYLKANLKQCNQSFTVKTNKTRVLLGRDSQNRPVYDYTFTESIVPVIVSTTFSQGNDNTQMPLPEGRLDITLPYVVADNITMNESFEMYNNQYKILDIDYTKVINGKGVMVIKAKRESEK